MIRLGENSSARSKSSNSTPVAERENRLKFAPAAATVAPSGQLMPVVKSLARSASVVGFPAEALKTFPFMAGGI